MTTEFIDLKEMQTADEALSLVRKRAPFTETIYSLYVTDKETFDWNPLSEGPCNGRSCEANRRCYDKRCR